jgi:hypothetical protein
VFLLGQSFIKEKLYVLVDSGFGYMHYGSQSKVDDVESECSHGLWGSNFDLTITYKVASYRFRYLCQMHALILATLATLFLTTDY